MSADASPNKDLARLRRQLDALDGVETFAARPGDASAERFQGYVSMRAADQAAVERLLRRLGTPFWSVFHVGAQKCELGFRVEVTYSQDELRYRLRFWGCPAWGLRRIRQLLVARIAGDQDRDALPSLVPPGRESPERSV